MLKISRMLASLFYLGFLPGMPGTYGSVVTALAFWGIYSMSHGVRPAYHVGALCVITGIGIAVSAVIGRRTGEEDPSYIIIDEAAGQLLTLLFLPVTPWTLLAGVILFRTFDIWKPWPIRNLERIGNGVGVMADDLLAGVYGNILLQLIHYFL